MLEPGSIVRLPTGLVGIILQTFDTPSGPRCTVRTGAHTETGLEIITNAGQTDVEFIAGPGSVTGPGSFGAVLEAAAEAGGSVVFGFGPADLEGAS